MQLIAFLRIFVSALLCPHKISGPQAVDEGIEPWPEDGVEKGFVRLSLEGYSGHHTDKDEGVIETVTLVR